jgi:hypothetical protein
LLLYVNNSAKFLNKVWRIKIFSISKYFKMNNLTKFIFAAFVFPFAANINAQTQTAIIGESSQLKFNISNVTNTNKCHIEVTLPNQQKVGVEVDGPQFLASVEFTPQQIGNNVIQWEGKNKLRGLKSVFACPGSGVIQVQVNGNTDQIAQKWNQYFSTVIEEIRDCVKVGMDLSQLKYQVLADPTVTLTSPQDPKLKPIYEKCESFAKQIQPRKGAPCTLASQNNLKTICDGVYAERQNDGRLKTISRTAAIQLQFEGKPWTVGVLENLDVRTARLKQEGEDKAKQADELAAKKQAEELAAKKQAEELDAKKQADEKERLFKLTPEYKKQQAALETKRIADEKEAARKQAEQEKIRIAEERLASAKVEKEKLEAAKLQKENEERANKQMAEAREATAKAEREAPALCKRNAEKCLTTKMLMDSFQGVSEIRKICVNSVKSVAKWDFQFQYVTPFPSYYNSVDDLKNDTIRLVDDNVKFQNGFGAWRTMKVTCHYKIKSKFAIAFVD